MPATASPTGESDPAIPFRVSHAIKIEEAASGVRQLQGWAIVAFVAMSSIGGGILAALLIR